MFTFVCDGLGDGRRGGAGGGVGGQAEAAGGPPHPLHHGQAGAQVRAQLYHVGRVVVQYCVYKVVVVFKLPQILAGSFLCCICICICIGDDVKNISRVTSLLTG